MQNQLGPHPVIFLSLFVVLYIELLESTDSLRVSCVNGRDCFFPVERDFNFSFSLPPVIRLVSRVLVFFFVGFFVASLPLEFWRRAFPEMCFSSPQTSELPGSRPTLPPVFENFQPFPFLRFLVYPVGAVLPNGFGSDEQFH